MKKLFACIILAAFISSCNQVKHIYNSNDVNERQLEKLVKNYLKHPGDTAAANRVVYAYNLLETEQWDKITRLQQNNSLHNLEQLVKEFNGLQDFYSQANQYPAVRELVNPRDISSQREQAINNAAAAWYDEANRLLASNHWKAGREAIAVLRKVNNWIPGFEDSKRLQQEAMEMGTIDVVIEPLRNEGFFYSSGYNHTGNMLTRQLVNDLDNRWNSQALYRVFDSREARNNQVDVDWLVEPVITRLQVEPVNYTRNNRTVTKTIEVGKDSLKNPVYKTISAVLTITEAAVCASTELEARISDLQTNERIGRRSFTETYTLRERSASYTGDKNALGNDDWKLVNNRSGIQVDERWLQQKLLEKVYPNLLDYIRFMLR
jgi:sulfur relay (sulfurtransferase) DsrC/TusE family protein